MTPPLLLDSMAAVRLANGDQLTAASLTAIRTAQAEGRATLVSPASAWELATLAQLGRVTLSPSPAAWFRAFLELPGIALAPMEVDVLLAAAELPGAPPADPAMRIIIASARHHGFRIVTRSTKLLAYAQSGYVEAMEC